MKKFNNDVVKGYNGKSIVWKIDGKDQELTLVNVLYAIMNSYNVTTQKDSVECANVSRVLDKVIEDGGVIELEDTTHYWLSQVAEKVTPSVFKVNGNVVYLTIKDGWIKEEKEPNKRRS